MQEKTPQNQIKAVKLVLEGPFLALWADKDPFQQAREIEGEIVRSKEGRTTKRCVIGDKVYYTKVHTGVGWGEIIKNRLQMRKAVTGASNEWLAIQLLEKLDVKTLELVGYGEQEGSAAKYTSFIATKEITNVISLAEYAKSWPQQAPDFKVKYKLIKKVAEIARTLHQNGLNHRDLYICHFLLELGFEAENEPVLNVVDLHRAQIRSKVPLRWLVKDVGSLYFSAMDVGLTKRDIYRFLKTYHDLPIRTILQGKISFLKKVKNRAERLYRRDFKKEPPELV